VIEVVETNFKRVWKHRLPRKILKSMFETIVPCSISHPVTLVVADIGRGYANVDVREFYTKTLKYKNLFLHML
jgi:hypothetical protein